MLLQAYIVHGSEFLTQRTLADPNRELMSSILGIFQKLLSSKVNDYLGFYILQSIVESLKPEVFSWSLQTIFRLIFQRLQGSKTGQLTKSLIIFLAIFIGKHGPDFVISHVNSVQPDIFAMVIQSIWLPSATQVVGKVERKAVAIAMVDLLCKTDKFWSPPYSEFPQPLLQCIVQVCEGYQAEPSIDDDAASSDTVEVDASSAGFSSLPHASKRASDLFATVPDPRLYFAHSLHQSSKTKPGRFLGLLQSAQQSAQFVTGYFQQASIPQPYVM